MQEIMRETRNVNDITNYLKYDTIYGIEIKKHILLIFSLHFELSRSINI